MFKGLSTSDSENLRFLLVSRPLTDGRTRIVLHLYRDERLASTTTISTPKSSVARMVLLASRIHLYRFGLKEHFPRLPRVANLELARAAA